MKALKIGTRKSQLALWQANWVKTKLEAAGHPCELVLIETIGDKKLDTTIAKIGSKGVFTEELELLLESQEIDLAVHSAKDLSSHLPEGFELIAFGPREEVCDVLISNKSIDTKAPLVVGTSSTRRVAQLAKYYPYFNTVPVRGNLQTRVKKMEEGACDALLLAKAGVVRMGLSSLIQWEFPLDQLTPAAGQGSIAVEAHSTLSPKLRETLGKILNQTQASTAIRTERAFLKTMDGGCSIPVFAYAHLQNEGIHLSAGILSLDGSLEIRRELNGTDSEALGYELGKQVLSAGGDRILNEIKKQLQ